MIFSSKILFINNFRLNLDRQKMNKSFVFLIAEMISKFKTTTITPSTLITDNKNGILNIIIKK